MTAEVDTRTIPGNGGTVALFASDDPARGYSVVVRGPAGRLAGEMRFSTAAEAVDAYRHPFANPAMPDVFARS